MFFFSPAFGYRVTNQDEAMQILDAHGQQQSELADLFAEILLIRANANSLVLLLWHERALFPF